MLVVLLTALILVALASGGGDFDPGEEIRGPGVEDIAAGTGEAPFPRRDASRFERGTEVVWVYLRVEDLQPGGRMTATVERSATSSVVSRFFGAEVRAQGGGEERLSVSESGASGVVTFAVRAGEALPEGEYTVEVRSDGGEGAGGGTLLARKYFLVGDRQA